MLQKIKLLIIFINEKQLSMHFKNKVLVEMSA
jgi:hypothetical protein